VVSAKRVARVIERRLRRPARDRNVGPANALTVAGFRFLPSVFDRIVSPLMRLGGLAEPASPTPGNVLRPRAARESVVGPWPGVMGCIRFRGAVSPPPDVVEDSRRLSEKAT
jgi:hypothetical protein